jgi:hypothetical protein
MTAYGQQTGSQLWKEIMSGRTSCRENDGGNDTFLKMSASESVREGNEETSGAGDQSLLGMMRSALP